MKRLNFNIKDRKVLYMILGIVFISIFTLTVAYAALNAVLNISGSAQVSSAEWDVHFDNVKVINGSVSGNDPRITSATTATFSTVLNMPGDFYEFTIDVVNDGSIDAMIENIIKTPTLSTDQAKYLKYDITYQNGESITTRQLVVKNSFVRLKVRLEYRSDITANDLPKTSETLTLGLKLDYIQSDGSGSVVSGNGRVMPVANGSINDIGTIVTIGSEQFYTIGIYANNVKLLAKYNLFVGGVYSDDSWSAYGTTATNMQKSDMLGYNTKSVNIRRGTTPFSSTDYMGEDYSDYSGSLVELYVNNYKDLLESNYDISINEARLITKNELVSSAIGCTSNSCSGAPSWISSTTYWTGTAYDYGNVWLVDNNRNLRNFSYSNKSMCGVRPVIYISLNNFINFNELISFSINDSIYNAYYGMTWRDWVESEFNIDNYRVTIDNMIYSLAGYDVRFAEKTVYGMEEIYYNGAYNVKTSGTLAPTSN